MQSIKYNNVELGNATYCVEYVMHQSAPTREIVLERLGDRDGQVIISSDYRDKLIRLKGVLIGTSAADLQTKIDTFKELFSRDAKNLDITPSGGIARRYVATCQWHNLPQESHNIKHIPWEAEFVVPTGEGKATSLTNHSDDNITSSPHTNAAGLVITGSKGPKPVITITIVNETTMTKIRFKNNTTGQYIEITRAFADAEVLEIDCENMTCEVGGVAKNFDGVFPDFIVGTNSYTLTITDGGVFDIDLDIDYYKTYL